MPLPFLFDDAEDIAHLKKRRAEFWQRLQTENRREALRAVVPENEREAARFTASLDLQSAELALANADHAVSTHALWDIVSNHPHDSEAAVAEQTAVLLAELEQLRPQAAAVRAQAQQAADQVTRAKERTMTLLFDMIAAERAVEILPANQNWRWPWRHLHKDVNKALAPHVRDELGWEMFYRAEEKHLNIVSAEEARDE